MLKAVPAQLFGVSLSSAKRYVRVAERGASLTPKKGGGRPPKTDETTRKLLEEDVKECPAATVYERCCFLQIITGKSLSSFTLKRLLKRMSFSQKTQCGGAEARLVSKSSMEGDGLGGGGPAPAGFCGRDGGKYLPLSPACVVAPRAASILLGSPQPWPENHLAGQHERGGYVTSVGGGGSDHRCRLRALHRGGTRAEAATGASHGCGQPSPRARASASGSSSKLGAAASYCTWRPTPPLTSIL